MPDGDDRAAALIVAYLEGTATEEEREELERRLPQEPELAERLALQARMTVGLESMGRQVRETRDLHVEGGKGWKWLVAAAACLAVAAGIVLLRPSDPVATPPGFVPPRVEVVRGAVSVERGKERRPAKPGLTLAPGDLLAVPRGGEAVVVYLGETTRLELRESTEVFFPPAERGKQLLVHAGGVAAVIAPQPEPFVFRTPHARLEVVGTRLVLTVNASATRLEVVEGKAVVRKAEESGVVDLDSGQFAVVEKGRPLAAERTYADRRRGLKGEYFDDLDFVGLKATRVDPRLDFRWGTDAPAPGVDPEGFSVRWTGQLLPAASELYTLTSVTDDGCRVWVNGELVIDHWTPQGRLERTGSIRLRAWELVDLRVEYFDQGGPAAAQLYWSSPSTPRQIIPEECLFAPLEGSLLQGLRGEYFDHEDLTNLKMTRVDSKVNFAWGHASPHPSIEPDYFSVRWTGQVEPQYSETYTFYTVSDDGVRLWVDGQPLIDDWKVRGTEERSGSITLVAAKRYDLRLEYFECVATAQVHLSWSSPSQRKQLIPQVWLYPPR